MNLLERWTQFLRFRDSGTPISKGEAAVSSARPMHISPIDFSEEEAEPTTYVPHSVTTIVHVDDDGFCFYAAKGAGDIERVTALARLTPEVKLVSEKKDQAVVTLPWSWVKIVVPSADGDKTL